MKFLTLSLLMILSLSSFAQHESMGGVAGGGVAGKQLLVCNGDIHIKPTSIKTVVVIVETNPQFGLLAKMIDYNSGSKYAFEKSTKTESLMGTTYKSKKLEIIVPNIQSHDLNPGEVRAIVKYGKMEGSILLCTVNN